MKITKEQLQKIDRKISRELELKDSTGWTAIHKVHKSVKNYSRKKKHKYLQF